jgi:hypothetical protein
MYMSAPKNSGFPSDASWRLAGNADTTAGFLKVSPN